MKHNYHTCDLCGANLVGEDGHSWWPDYDIRINDHVKIEPIFKIWDGRSEINMLELCDECTDEMRQALWSLFRRYRSPVA